MRRSRAIGSGSRLTGGSHGDIHRDDVVAFDAAVFDGGSEDLIRLTSGQIEITDGLTITGGPSGVTITGDASGDDVTLAGGITDVDASLAGEDRLDDNSRLFDATAALTLDGLTLTGGRTMGELEAGGAVRGTNVTLIDSTVSGNSTAGDFSAGGGVWGFDVTLIDSTISGNSTAGSESDGGGVGGINVVLTNSTVSGNSTAGFSSDGGGVWGSVDVMLTNSTVSGNSTAGNNSEGGGISGFDVTLINSVVSGNSTAGRDSNGGGVGGVFVTVTNSTVSGNSTAGDTSDGGGVFSASRMTLTNSTVSGNSTAGDASEGGGVWAYEGTLTNSIVLGNASIFAGADGDEGGGALTLTGGNIVGGDLFDDDVDVGDVTAAEVFAATTEIAPGVLAGVLADNGGPTRTILIAADGPAVDAGGVATLPIDQRGLARVSGAAVDLGAVELGAGPAEQGSLVVTTALDVVATDGLTSLREAAFFANLQRGTDTITFDASVFDGEAADVIRLTGGQIDLTEALILVGGAAGVTITGDANGDDVTLAGGITDVDASGAARLADNSRIFDAIASLTLDGMTLTGGRTMARGESGGAVQGAFGGSVTLIDSTVSGNSTAGDTSEGGGIWAGSVTLTNSTVSGNSTTGDTSEGGGVWAGSVTLTNSTVSGNNTAGDSSRGGGVSGSVVTLTNSTVSGNNTAGDFSGGGGVSGSVVTLTNSTISGNSTVGDDSGGGGVWGFDVTLTNSTVSGNSTAGDESGGGGVFSFSGVMLTNSIVLGNATISAGVDGDEVEGVVTRTGGNILGSDLFAGDADVGDIAAAEVFAATTEIVPGVRAGVLADNGGPTRTILIAAEGPAVDAGGATALPRTDQRGLERVFGAAVDLGAVELGAGPAEPGSLVVTTALDVVATDGLTSLREAVFFANLDPGTDTIGFDAGVFDGEARDVIRLTGGQIDITEALTIAGGATGVTITGDAGGDDVTLAGGITDVAASLEGDDRLDDNSRIFDAIASLTLDGLTLTGGRTRARGESGGAVHGTTVTLIDSTVSGNSTAGFAANGGGVSGFGSVTLIDSTVSGNSTAGDYSRGGGITGSDGVTLTNSTISGNSTAGYGSNGGGVSGFGSVTLTNSTVSGNSTAGDYSRGGGVWGGDGVTLTNSIVLGNVMISSGEGDDAFAGEFKLTGGNILGGDLFDGDADVGDVAAEEVFAATTEIAPGVRAGVLADNGGPTRTIAIRAEGPAAGAADPASAMATDQRGFARDDAPDLGAFEAGAEGGLKLVGGPRADVLVGGAGDDQICGRGGSDLLRGLAGDDLLRGGTGCDILKGGTGDDLLYGGRGHDVFIFGPDPGADTIVGFDANPHCGQDQLDLRALGISAASFASAVAITQIDDDTLITLQDGGSILCTGINGEGVAVIDQSDFLLLA